MIRVSCSFATLLSLSGIFALLTVAAMATTTPAKAQSYLSVACNGMSGDLAAVDTLPATCTYQQAPGYQPTYDGGPWANVDLLHDSVSSLETLHNPTSEDIPAFDIVHAQICLSDLKVPPSKCPNNYPINADNERWGYQLNPQVFQMLNSGFSNLRAAGLKVVLRFTYNYPSETAKECETKPIQDAPIGVILRHMRELAPVIRANRDVILALQAGFIGCWGEWHNSTHDNEIIAHHNAFLDEYTHLFKGVTTLEVRRPYVALDYSRHIYGDIKSEHVLALGFGIHDDFFGMNSTDSNTFLPETPSEDPHAPQYSTCLLRRTTVALARRYSMTGETNLGYHFDIPTGCESSVPDPKSFLAFSQDYSLKTLQWNEKVQKFADAQQLLVKIGPHLILERAVIMRRDGGLSVAVNIRNTGWAAITAGRTAFLKLADQKGHVVASVKLPLDLKSIEPDKSVSMKSLLPEASLRGAGTYTLYIEAPDNSPRLARTPTYSLLFDTVGVPDRTTGRNVLASLTVAH